MSYELSVEAFSKSQINELTSLSFFLNDIDE
jgi:hypothetical protein